jgi:hypothetical protein
MFEIEYEFREEDLVHFNELRLKDDPLLQKDMLKSRLLVPGVMFLIGLFYYIYYQNLMTTAYIAFLAIGWSIMSPYVIKMDLRRQFLKNYTAKENLDMFGLHKLTIEQEYLAEQSPGGKHKNYWKDMVRVDFLEKYIHIYLDLNSAIVIPKETMKNGDLEKFAKQAESMIDRLS